MCGESDANPAGAVQVVAQFNDALNRRDLEAMMARMAPDCIFENTYPAPDGSRYQGQAKVRAFWEEFFLSSSHSTFEIEELFALGSRCVMRWTYRWADASGVPGHVRGVDLYRVEDGLIVEKLSYVKG
jgi:limonene-1,2-epoxide hydrolase